MEKRDEEQKPVNKDFFKKASVGNGEQQEAAVRAQVGLRGRLCCQAFLIALQTSMCATGIVLTVTTPCEVGIDYMLSILSVKSK